MLRVTFYFTFLIGVAALAFWRGRREERLAALVCVVGTALTVVTADPRAVRFASFGTIAFVIDLGVFLAFLAIALRSERFWPLWVAGLQLTAATIHPMMLISPVLAGRVFGAALAFWSYPILLLIAIGTLRTQTVERWRAEADIASGRVIS
ncbi:hypothetical protein [Sphingomonas humi]|uniref:Uncharacterized protein n=1 Tax=Sphingomonas humi TaxID=335630 RepID=A0ABP7RFL2_9SPHN